MNINRRWFLGGSLALVGALSVPASQFTTSQLPILWGDGIHDDADALNAIGAGNPFIVEKTGIVEHECGFLQDASFLISRPITFRPKAIHVKNCVFQSTDDFEGDAMLRFIKCTLDKSIAQQQRRR